MEENMIALDWVDWLTIVLSILSILHVISLHLFKNYKKIEMQRPPRILKYMFLD
jgi:hypothetical protein